MVRLINKTTNSIMWVADERKDEYLAAGHKLAVSSSAKKPTEQEKVVEVKETEAVEVVEEVKETAVVEETMPIVPKPKTDKRPNKRK